VIRPRRVRHVLGGLVAAGLLVAAPAFPAGFEIFTQGARATGMGLAFAAVADDPTAIFYNPAGLGWQQHFSVELGSSFITKLSGDFHGANPFPGDGTVGDQHKTTFVLPTFYLVLPLTNEINLGIGAFSQYGLGYRWDGGESWVGRFISSNAVIKSVDLNPVLSWRLTPQIAIAGGADYRISMVQLEKDNATYDPLTDSFADTSHVKLDSSIWDNHKWGWNVGIMIRPAPEFSVGAAYRSAMTINYTGTATFTQNLTGDPVLDAIVASKLPVGKRAVTTSIGFPASMNLGISSTIAQNTTIALEADWTEWSKFQSLNISFPDLPGGTTCAPNGIMVCRQTNWKDSWAYRFGVEQKLGKWSLRTGFYIDKTPQPAADAGPILADNDRTGYTFGFGYNTDHWGINLADLYLKVKDRTVAGESTDNFFGTYHESVNIAIFGLRFSF